MARKAGSAIGVEDDPSFFVFKTPTKAPTYSASSFLSKHINRKVKTKQKNKHALTISILL